MRVCFSHLNEHRFNQNFQSCINSLRSCSLEIESTTHFLHTFYTHFTHIFYCNWINHIESTTHFLLHFHHFSNIRSTLLNSKNKVFGSISNLDDFTLVEILLFGDQNYLGIKIIVKRKTHISLVLLLSI